MTGSERLAARLRAMRSRATIRSWERRQRHHARGSWDRLARCLAVMRSAWAISDEDAAALLAGGLDPEPAGLAFEPPRRLFVVTEAEVAKLASARPIALQASAELLSTPNLALVRFGPPGGEDGARSERSASDRRLADGVAVAPLLPDRRATR